MNNVDKIFVIHCECVMQELKLKEELDAALARYNALFVPGSKKILVLQERDHFRDATNMVVDGGFLTDSMAIAKMPISGGHFRDRYLDIGRTVSALLAYVSRLEAAYLQLYRDSIRGSGPDQEAIKGRMARESLERIKRGDPK